MTENSPYYADWYDYAREELDMAEVALAKDHLRPAAVHVHQALEKVLKGFIIRNGERPPRTHSLPVLLDLAATHREGLESDRDWLITVSAYYETFHYPGKRTADREALVSDIASAKSFLEKLMGEGGRG